jgi:hypothetical protein
MPLSRCLRADQRLGASSTSTCASARGNASPYRQSCGGRRERRQHVKHVGRSQARSSFFQRTWVGQTSQWS